MKMPKIEQGIRYFCKYCGRSSIERCDIACCEEECEFEEKDRVSFERGEKVFFYLTGAEEYEYSTREEAEEALALAEIEIEDVSWVETDAFWRWKEGVIAKRHNEMRRKA